jgi:outer membrane protein TolC
MGFPLIIINKKRVMTKRRSKLSLLFGVMCLCFNVYSQEVLTLSQYLENIQDFHPLVKVVDNQSEIAKQLLRSAKGSFDPKVSADWNLKDYKNKEYFDIRSAKIKVPTTLGLNFVGKYEQNAGLFLNEQNTVPDQGLLGAGIEVPLIRGMFTDGNRQKLREARVKRDWQVVINDSTLNAIYYNAIFDYVQWAASYKNVKVAEELISIRSQRFQNVQKNYEGGFNSPMDTLDAFSQLQSAQKSQLEALNKFIKNRYVVANHIWNPSVVSNLENLVPDEFDALIKELELFSSKKFNLEDHNFVQAYQYKWKAYETEYQYWKEMVKPQLDLGVMSLSGPATGLDAINTFSASNYLIGMKLELPLNIRKAHGKMKALNLKMQNTMLKREMKQKEVMNKWLALTGMVNNQEQQYILMTSNADNLKKIRNLEEKRFTLGESSLFKLNGREDKMFEAQAKQIKAGKSYANIQLEKLFYSQSFSKPR